MADKIILFRESALSSVISDSFTIAMLAALPWFNHQFLGGSGWLYAAIAFAWFISIISRGSGMKAKNTMTAAEVRAWLDEHHPAER